MKARATFFVAVLILAVAPAAAETITLNATLVRDTATSPNSTDTVGDGRFTFDTVTRQLSYSVHYKSLSGAATAADIHGPASTNETAPIVVHFYVPESPISGSATLTEAQANALLSGRLYVEIDTAARQAGEARGQIHR